MESEIRHSILINMKAFAWCAGFILLLSTIPAVAELRAPAKVALDLGTEIRSGERQAVLLLSAAAGTACAGTPSDLKTMAKFDQRSAVIEILGYDFTPAPHRTDHPCPTALGEARGRVPLSKSWLKPDMENRMVFVLGSNKNSYRIKRVGFRVELLPENATTVLARQRGENLTVPPSSSATILWPLNVGRLYLTGAVIPDHDFRVALRAFAKANQMLPADEVHQSLQMDAPAQLWVRLTSGTLPPPSTGRARRIGALPGHPGVEVYLGAPTFDLIRLGNRSRYVGSF
ncbi:MAG TPA: hypothetical protein VE422_40270 [Terriglobia bacterium]|nr:hypothetical protein [Terriglobia bacterium]